MGSGCGSVGRAVASDTRGPRFESSHQQKFIYKLNICYCQLCIEKTTIQKKRPGMAKKNNILVQFLSIDCNEICKSSYSNVRGISLY